MALSIIWVSAALEFSSWVAVAEPSPQGNVTKQRGDDTSPWVTLPACGLMVPALGVKLPALWVTLTALGVMAPALAVV